MENFKLYTDPTEQSQKAIKKSSMRNVFAILFIIFAFVLMVWAASKGSPSSSSSSSSSSDLVAIGQEGYLRITSTSTPDQMILLAPTPEVWDEVGKSFSVNDTYGLVELSGKGVFGVSNGTKILVIDKKGTLAPLYKVRILQGVRSIDEDKVGRAGWLPRDFVSAN